MGCKGSLLTATKATSKMGSLTDRGDGSKFLWSKEDIENRNKNFTKKGGTPLVKDKDYALDTRGSKRERWLWNTVLNTVFLTRT